MKLMIDPMPALKSLAELKINTYFVEHHKNVAYRRVVWSRKRIIAEEVLKGIKAPQAFAEEAKLRNLSVEDFARLVISKPDVTEDQDILELKRQKLLAEIAAATSHKQIEAIENKDLREIVNG